MVSQNKTCSFLVDQSLLLKTGRPGLQCLFVIFFLFTSLSVPEKLVYTFQLYRNVALVVQEFSSIGRLNQDLIKHSKKVHGTSKLWSVCLHFFFFFVYLSDVLFENHVAIYTDVNSYVYIYTYLYYTSTNLFICIKMLGQIQLFVAVSLHANFYMQQKILNAYLLRHARVMYFLYSLILRGRRTLVKF